jgi:hypothetical protein
MSSPGNPGRFTLAQYWAECEYREQRQQHHQGAEQCGA